MVCEPAVDPSPLCPLFEVYSLFPSVARAVCAASQADRAILVWLRGSERGVTTTACLANEADLPDHHNLVLFSSNGVSWPGICVCGLQVFSHPNQVQSHIYRLVVLLELFGECPFQSLPGGFHGRTRAICPQNGASDAAVLSSFYRMSMISSHSVCQGEPYKQLLDANSILVGFSYREVFVRKQVFSYSYGVSFKKHAEKELFTVMYSCRQNDPVNRRERTGDASLVYTRHL
jgi:hypothetical protein